MDGFVGGVWGSAADLGSIGDKTQWALSPELAAEGSGTHVRVCVQSVSEK